MVAKRKLNSPFKSMERQAALCAIIMAGFHLWCHLLTAIFVPAGLLTSPMGTESYCFYSCDANGARQEANYCHVN